MKRKAFIPIICSLIAVATIMIATLLIFLLTGFVTVEKTEIRIATSSASAEYSGKPLTNDEWTLVSGTLKEGHKLSVTVTGSQTAVGISENYAHATIVDEDGNDVTDKYNVVYELGLLKVSTRPITITAGSAAKEYDGTPLTSDAYDYTPSTALITGHTIEAVTAGSQTDVGASANRIVSVIIKSATGEDVTSFYDVKTLDGVLEVLPKPLIIKASSAVKQYDGTPLTSPTFEVTNPEILFDGHTVEAVVEGSQTEIGMSPNVVTSVIIKDANGNDVTADYNVRTINGILEVVPKPIIIEASSAKKEYDGTPLISPEWTNLTPESLAQGHSITAVVEGSQTEIGISPNVVTSVIITDENGNNVTGSYIVETKDGTLEVVEPTTPPPKPNPDDDPVIGGGDGDDDGNNNGDNDGGGGDGGVGGVGGGDPNAWFVINSDTTGVIYLKVKSFGNYTGTLNWAVAQEYDKYILGGRASAFYLPSEAVKYTGARPARITILSNCGIYVLPYYNYMGDESLQTSDTVVKGKTTNKDGDPEPYKVYYFTSLNGATLPSGYKDYEAEYSTFVHDQYLRIDTETKNYMDSIIAAENFNLNDPDIINKIANYVKTSASLNPSYDSSLDSSSNVAVSFLRDYKEGTSKHFATAATMLYRALGIPARYTEGFAGNIEEANVATNVYGNRQHSWVEVYIDGFGWVCVEVTGRLKKIDVPPTDSEDLPVTPSDSNDDENVLGDLPDTDGNDGNNVGTDSNGSLTGGSSSGNPVPIFKITSDKGGNIYLKQESFGDYNKASGGFNKAPEYPTPILGTKSAYYLVPYALENGMLKINNIKIDPLSGIFALPYYTQTGGGIQTSDVKMSGDASKAYNVKYYSWQGTSGVIVPADYIEYELEYRRFVKENYLTIDDETAAYMQSLTASLGFSASDPDIIYKVATYIQNAAKYKLEYDPKLDEESNIVVAFLKDYKEGLCRHYAAAATMMFRSLGIPARYTVGFVAQGVKAGVETTVTSKMGHAWVEVYVDGIGWIYVEVTGSADPEDDEDDSKPIKIDNLTPAYISQKYVGQTLTHTGVIRGTNPLTEKGYRYEATVSGSISEPGTTMTTITEFLIYDSDDNLVYQMTTGFGNDKFDLTFKQGTMQLFIDTLIFSSSSCNESKTYDGKALTVDASDCILISGNLADGYWYEITPTGTITNAGKMSANFTVTIYKYVNGVRKDCSDHYSITRNYGTLTVNAKYIEFTAKSATKAFDGTPLTCNEIEYDASLLADGERVKSFEVVGSRTTIGDTANVIEKIVIVNAAGTPTTGNYEIKINDGTLTVTKP